MGTGILRHVWVAIGSNLGDSLQQLKDACIFLQSLSVYPIKKSSIYRSEPIGGIANQPFLNAVVEIQTHLEAEPLLRFFKSFEKKQGRDMNVERWSNRLIDLDIIAIDQEYIVTDLLKVPHKEYHKRSFVLVPFNEINPDWIDPVQSKTLQDLIAEIDSSGLRLNDKQWKDSTRESL